MSFFRVSVLSVMLSARKPMRMSLPPALEKGITRCPGRSSVSGSPPGSHARPEQDDRQAADRLAQQVAAVRQQAQRIPVTPEDDIHVGVQRFQPPFGEEAEHPRAERARQRDGDEASGAISA